MYTHDYVRSVEAQILGRVFSLDDSVHFVLDIDEQTGMARCSRSTPTGPGIVYMPVTEVRLWLAEDTRYRDSLDDGRGDDDQDDGFPDPWDDLSEKEPG